MGPWSQFSHLPQAENRSKPNPLRAALYESGLELGMGKVYKVHPEWLELGSIFDLRLDLLNLFIKFHWFPTNDRKNKLNNRIVAQGWCIYCYFLDLDLMTYQNNPTSLWVSCIIYMLHFIHHDAVAWKIQQLPLDITIRSKIYTHVGILYIHTCVSRFCKWHTPCRRRTCGAMQHLDLWRNSLN